MRRTTPFGTANKVGATKIAGWRRYLRALLAKKWQHPTDLNTFYSMRPEHRPLRCNYPHTEVVVYKEENGTETLQELIKPTSIKLKIREELQKHLKVALPIERQGETFSV